MTMEEMIAAAFAVSLLLSAFTPVHPAAYGCLLPVAAASVMIFIISVWPSGSSTEGLAVPFAFMFAACGSVPGAFAGAGLKSYLRK